MSAELFLFSLNPLWLLWKLKAGGCFDTHHAAKAWYQDGNKNNRLQSQQTINILDSTVKPQMTDSLETNVTFTVPEFSMWWQS
jgi:hypothetical protein